MTGRVVIVGGGIGGLTLAIALGRAGIPCVLLEREPAPSATGSGLGLWGRAVGELEGLGLARALERRSVAIERAQIRDPNGRVLLDLDLLGSSPPTRFLRRAELHALLHESLPPSCELRLGARCTGIAGDDRGASATLATGEHVPGDLVVGADGLRSVVREHLWPGARCRTVGQTAWRGILEAVPEHASLAWEAWGPGARFGIAPLQGGQTCWWTTGDAEPLPDAAGIPEHEHDALVARVAPFGPCASGPVAMTPPASILRTALHESPPLPASHRGRVALLGDAAHAMTPNLGQGAGAAIEDAVVLAALLAQHEVPAALAAYEDARRARTRRLARAARLVGDVGHWRNPLLRAARNTALRVAPASALRRLFLS